MAVAAISILLLFCLLLVAFKVLDAIDKAKRIRDAKCRERSEGRTVCRWGVDSDGGEFRVYVRIPPSD